uniref:Uncharacterized protein n=1 Tax=Felis catus TaxID=9685 RepID=A0ABI7XB25_FELCA
TEGTGQVGKNAVLSEQEKNNEHCLQDIDDKLSESTDDDGEDDTNNEDNDEDINDRISETQCGAQTHEQQDHDLSQNQPLN